MKKAICTAAFAVLFSVAICGLATGETLTFQDNFNGSLTTNWNPGTNTTINDGGHQLTVTGGKLAWSQGYDHIESKQTFSGDFRVEVDVERTQGSSQCWDFAIELTGVDAYAGVLRLQYGGVTNDSLNVGDAPSMTLGGSTAQGVCVGDGGQWLVEAPTASPHTGTFSLTHQAGSLTFSFKNSAEETITTGPISVGDVGAPKVRIWGKSNYRYVDEVRVYDLSDGCPSTATSLEIGAASYDLTIPSLCYDGETHDVNLRIRLNADGTWELF
ncbi:MAG: hypothetical protein GY859_40185 [Desulfobacterales bacterium]|nr:hypothetical protein [Desulfobacterales bacterium]